MRWQKLLAAVALFAYQTASAAELRAFPEEYRISRAPAEYGLSAIPEAPPPSQTVEHQQSVDGTVYTAITPIYTGQNNNTSYLRFANGNVSTSVTTITIIG